MKKGGQVAEPFILVKICYNNVSFKELKNINFLALADIKPFGRACLFAMLLLIGLALFYTPGVFV